MKTRCGAAQNAIVERRGRKKCSQRFIKFPIARDFIYFIFQRRNKMHQQQEDKKLSTYTTWWIDRRRRKRSWQEMRSVGERDGDADQYQYMCVNRLCNIFSLILCAVVFFLQLNWPFRRNGRKAFIANWIKITLHSLRTPSFPLPSHFTMQFICVFFCCGLRFPARFSFLAICSFFVRIFTSKRSFLSEWNEDGKTTKGNHKIFRDDWLEINFLSRDFRVYLSCIMKRRYLHRTSDLFIITSKPLIKYLRNALTQKKTKASKTIRNISSPNKEFFPSPEIHKSFFYVPERNFRSRFPRAHTKRWSVQWSRYFVISGSHHRLITCCAVKTRRIHGVH